MIQRVAAWAALTAVLLLAATGSAGAQGEGGIAVGAHAPAVIVNDLDGNPVNLAGVIGKKPLVLQWWATWCDLCKELLPRVRAAYDAHRDQVEFFGINVTVNQSPARVRRYLQEHRPPYRTLYDTGGTSTRAYQVPTTSFMVVVDRSGTVVYTGTGGNQDLLPVVARVAAR
ncbi:MAG TPA: TlpA disulfide reductase family protein [Gemmatimonadales bacterium]|nr:TlpA disulfide reductase family protein [Gemmatimonadales bacterium]